MAVDLVKPSGICLGCLAPVPLDDAGNLRPHTKRQPGIYDMAQNRMRFAGRERCSRSGTPGTTVNDQMVWSLNYIRNTYGRVVGVRQVERLWTESWY